MIFLSKKIIRYSIIFLIFFSILSIFKIKDIIKNNKLSNDLKLIKLSNLNYKLTKKFMNLKPNCDKLSSYNKNSKDYWQFYGYDNDYQINLNDEILDQFLLMNQNQIDELTKINQYLINDFLNNDKDELINEFNQFVKEYYTTKSSTGGSNDLSTNNDDEYGIVYVTGDKYYWLTISSIKYIRHNLKDNTPIELFMPYYDIKDELICNTINSVYGNIKCSFFSNYLSKAMIDNFDKGYQYKSLALLLTRFKNSLYLDSDNFLIIKPKKLFNSEIFNRNGLVLWPDFWKRSTHPNFYKFTNLIENNKKNSIVDYPSVESGQILINKSNHVKTLILSYYYNFYGPSHFYPLLNQGFPGEGDKETLFLSSKIVDENVYLIKNTRTKILGYQEQTTNKFFGQCILQKNPENLNEFAFLHCNYPKLFLLNEDEINLINSNNKNDKIALNNNLNDEKNANFKNEINNSLNRRTLRIVRNAKSEVNSENSNSKNINQAIDIDIELKIWENFKLILDEDFVKYKDNFQFLKIYNNDYVKKKIDKKLKFLLSNKY